MVLLAVGQMTSTNDLDSNLATCTELVARAKTRHAVMLSLPEGFSFLGEKDNEGLAVAETIDGARMASFRDLARDNSMWLSLGGFQEKGPDDKHAYNTHVVIDAEGEVRAAYRKLHLFDVDIPGGPKLLESNGVTAGDELVQIDTPLGSTGLSICYDLRFPEMYLALAQLGSKLLLIPAAFTMTTGKEHWETLLRARAIETQCYVAAAAQTGRHNPRRQSFGHAMIIDPWGTVIAQCHDGDAIAVADIDLGFLDSVRQRIPVWNHRRPEVYGRVGDA